MVGRVEGPTASPHVDSQGEYRVRLPFQVSDAQANVAIRMPKAEPAAGDNRQHFPLMPDSAVLVQYLHGESNVSTPIITGARHWLKHPSPTVDQNNTQYRMQMANGLQWTFDDGAGQRATIHCPATNSTLNIGSGHDIHQGGVSMRTCCITGSAEDRLALAVGVPTYGEALQEVRKVLGAARSRLDVVDAQIMTGVVTLASPNFPADRGFGWLYGKKGISIAGDSSVVIAADHEPGAVSLIGECINVVGEAQIALGGKEVGISGGNTVEITSQNRTKTWAKSSVTLTCSDNAGRLGTALTLTPDKGRLEVSEDTYVVLGKPGMVGLACGKAKIFLTPDSIFLDAPRIIARSPIHVG